MFPDPDFFKSVSTFYRPGMGTEYLAPWLYSSIRMTKPTCVLEVGAGYTTPFLLKALLDNREEWATHEAALAEKSQQFHDLRETIIDQVAKGQETPQAGTDRLKEAQAEWECQNPALANPEYFETAPIPSMIVIESMDSECDSGLFTFLEQLSANQNEADLLQIQRSDFRGQANTLLAENAYFDWVWFDCGGYEEYRDFLDEYWCRIDPNGGTLLLHNTVNNPVLAHIVKDLQIRQNTASVGRLEIMSLWEPNKFRQNSVTIIRRIEGLREDLFQAHRVLDRLLTRAHSAKAGHSEP